MKELATHEMEQVNGGNEGQSDTDKVRENARTAVDTCGAGNVKSVTTEGFECK
tara:strand:+ start:319 stop:477 length:159 start_codon:yes stop_codon:yes gene_type:complete